MKIHTKLYVKNGALEEYRKLAGLNMIQAAKACKLKISRYRRIENLKINPTEDEMCFISAAFAIPIDILFPNECCEIVEILSGAITDKIIDYSPTCIEDRRDTKLLQTVNNEITIKKLLEILKPYPKAVIEYRNGLNGNVGRFTLKETGKAFGVTQERIRQIEAKAYEQMRQYAKKVNLIF